MTNANREDPTVIDQETYENTAKARRVTLTDGSGGTISDSNPLPVQLDGDFAINVQIDSGDSQIEYIGTAVIGSVTSAAVWKIKRVNYTTGTVIKYADGNESFDNIFDNRESLNYS